MKSIKDINLDIEEGKLLLATLSKLSCQKGYSDKEPDEILLEMSKISKTIFD